MGHEAVHGLVGIVGAFVGNWISKIDRRNDLPNLTGGSCAQQRPEAEGKRAEFRLD